MKGNAVYKGAYNRCLSYLGDVEVDQKLPSNSELASKLAVSRTTVRSVLSSLTDAGILRLDDAIHSLQRRPEPGDYFPETQTMSAAAAVERRFMEWILQGDFRAGQLLNSAELARQFGTSTTTIREYLTHFQHFGLIERRPNSAWVFLGVTPNFAAEIYEVREMFELRSARHLLKLPDSDPCWRELQAIEAEHLELLADIDRRYREFPALDERLHRCVHDASKNRYIIEFYNVVSAFFHYTYQWNIDDEKQRNIRALMQHLDYIAALRSRDPAAVEANLLAHLGSARATLLRSIQMGPFKVQS
ncbi:GntR family transcriptional regulator [Agrobacterium rhizogenes]|uniref:GntR family transcriptional regulator n=1 Tax=Rhizobium rhizogenes TaxID=359 RepID=UPI0004D660A9|nr:GntR family transcriptional regulator [Rhizobium rhizogenes]OCJ04651.1 GntR family transcriptional regulator [Agrobacterium sp. 13-626]OCJ23728.1 GntR family transcriptional regulator [Agrobacterium sp. B131/95]OCJ30108.1 GntR family transcriptional regulator [Agrobacterium sp. B133/95]KEA07858.1 GntR family transcriptional regulator [Rhizobium rhizogenes]MDJ1635158.1 GntR family transcriptional regulator [Rhizobium rhizogenes]